MEGSRQNSGERDPTTRKGVTVRLEQTLVGEGGLMDSEGEADRDLGNFFLALELREGSPKLGDSSPDNASDMLSLGMGLDSNQKLRCPAEGRLGDGRSD